MVKDINTHTHTKGYNLGQDESMSRRIMFNPGMTRYWCILLEIYENDLKLFKLRMFS